MTAKEKEEAQSVATQNKKSKMKRMDSVNSTAAGGTQSQMSEVGGPVLNFSLEAYNSWLFCNLLNYC